MPKVTVIVQTCPARRQSREATLASLRVSDVGEDLSVMEHPEGVSKCSFFASVLQAMASAPTPYVMRCEDDVLVNQHILHNFLTWPALDDPLFGAGWLYVSEAAFRTAVRVRGHYYRNTEVMYGSLCVAMPVEHAAAALRMLQEWAKEYGCPIDTCKCERRNQTPRQRPIWGQDAVLSRSVYKLGKRVFFHDPVLAENRLVPSTHGLKTTGHPAHWRAGKLFKKDWKRSP